MNVILLSSLTMCILLGQVSAFAGPPVLVKNPVSMVTIAEGSFIRGSGTEDGRADERPRRTIYLTAFMIDQYEVTNDQYLRFIAATGHKEPFNVYGTGSLSDVKGIGNLPVVQVTWHDAADYCQWAGKRLPTEAEWEKAARGTDGRQYPWGDAEPSAHHVNFNRDWVEKGTLLSVGSLPEGASPYGVHDMSGNAREWVQDWYAKEYYQVAPDRNPKGPETGLLKVVRGGSWHSFESDIRAAARGKGGFALKTHGTGFRCARDVSATPRPVVRGQR